MPEQSQFERGDVVRLKSSGPSMTIVDLDDTEAICRWFNGEKFDIIKLKLFELKSASADR